MSPIQSVQGASVSAAALAAAQAAPKTQAAKPETGTQEAQEPNAVRRAEAQKGDRLEIQRLAQAQDAKQVQKAPPVATAPDGNGGQINLIA